MTLTSALVSSYLTSRGGHDDSSHNQKFSIFFYLTFLTSGPKVIAAFNALQIAGLICLILILVTAFVSSKVGRLWTWYPLIIAAIFNAVSMLTLAMNGAQLGQNPYFGGLCFFQGALIEAAPAWLSFTTLAYSIDVYQSVRARAGKKVKNFRGRRVLLLCAPFAVGVFVFIEAVAVALSKGVDFFGGGNSGPGHGSSTIMPLSIRDWAGAFCLIPDDSVTLFGSLLSGISLLSVLALLSITARTMHRRRLISSTINLGDAGTISFWTIIRLVSLSIIIAVVIGLTIPVSKVDQFSFPFEMPKLATQPNFHAIMDEFMKQMSTRVIFIALTPLAISVAIGFDQDIIRAWMFWRREEPPAQDVEYVASIKALDAPSELTKTSNSWVTFPSQLPAGQTPVKF